MRDVSVVIVWIWMHLCLLYEVLSHVCFVSLQPEVARVLRQRRTSARSWVRGRLVECWIVWNGCSQWLVSVVIGFSGFSQSLPSCTYSSSLPLRICRTQHIFANHHYGVFSYRSIFHNAPFHIYLPIVYPFRVPASKVERVDYLRCADSSSRDGAHADGRN